jgi:hypothetical protein
MMIGGMAKQWITAAKALAIVAEHSTPSVARLALCSRAHEDLVGTKADLLTIAGKRYEDAPVPASFWWADGHEALIQDWPVGDFSTWLDRKVEWRAFGVLFDLEGVLAISPPSAAPPSESASPWQAIRRGLRRNRRDNA